MSLRNTAVLQFFLIFVLALAHGFAQAGTGTLQGKVSDPSGAVVQKATVTAVSESGKQFSATSNAQGRYELDGLAPGNYTVTVTASGFSADTETAVKVSAGMPQQLDVGLQISVEKQQLDVQDNTNTVDTSSENNASSLIIKGKDLDALSDDPDELQTELEALAGPSAGPNGGQMYIDGFTAGQLPPKASIREIRINQNPFSAEYDKLGYGRIEIFTKPGLDSYHGQFFVIGNDSNFNSPNPFATNIPPYHSEQFSGNISGPLISKKASFFFSAERRNINDESIVAASVLDNPDPNTYNKLLVNQAVSTPRQRTNIGPRVDFQLTPNNTLTARYQYWLDNESNQGVSGFSLPSLGYTSHSAEHTLQLSDTQILGPAVINETRFQFIRELTQDTPQNFSPQISVQGAFNTGGNTNGYSNDHQDRYEFQNYTSVVKGRHIFKFGGRLRETRDASYSNQNFNGAYTFSSLYSYALTQYYLNQGVPIATIQSDPTAYCAFPSTVTSNISPQHVQCAGIRQYSQSTGTPTLIANYVDAGLYFQDEFKVRPNFTLSYGLRYETQNAIGDHGDWAPRVGLAWGIGGKGKGGAKTVLRAGYGIFYERFGILPIVNTERLNGITQQEFIFPSPSFYDPSAPLCDVSGCGGAIGGSQKTIYQTSPSLRAPYTMQAAVSMERQLWKNATGALTYINSRGLHQLVTINANAPYMPGYDPTQGNIYQYYTEGIFKQNQLIANINWRGGNHFSLFGNYTLNYANSDVSGTNGGGFVSNSLDLTQDYGNAAFAVRNRAMLGGSVSLPYGLRFSPFMVVSSGQRFNIVTGQDLNGDSIFNDRPYQCANATDTGCVGTPSLGYFTATPPAGAQLVPANYGVGPATFTFNARFGKTWGLGPKLEKNADAGTGGGPPPSGGGSHGGGGGGTHGGGGNPFGGGMGGGRGGPFGADASTRKYSLSFNVMVRNLFNVVNDAAPVGNLNSPFFGQSIAMAGGPFGAGAYNRRLDLQVVFAF
jgi:hypothetical protein